ncbi:MAG: hypothetical protein WCO78_00995 [Candidatus Roizmanbacteria bacterium]
MLPTPVLLAQCINIGSGIPQVAGTCPAGYSTKIVQGINKCFQSICGPIATVAQAPGVAGDGLTLGWLIGVVMGYVYPFAGIILFFVFASAGYDYILSWGEPEKITGAQTKITYGLIGMALLVASYMLARLVGAIMGLDLPF